MYLDGADSSLVAYAIKTAAVTYFLAVCREALLSLDGGEVELAEPLPGEGPLLCLPKASMKIQKYIKGDLDTFNFYWSCIRLF